MMANKEIDLTLDDGKACTASVSDPFAKVYRKFWVKWKIVNNCSTDREVKIVFPNGSPLEGSCQTKKRVRGNGGRDEIKCNIRDNADVRKHKYEVHGGDRVLDPELDVREPSFKGKDKDKDKPMD
jgi:hypothetical protein